MVYKNPTAFFIKICQSVPDALNPCQSLQNRLFFCTMGIPQYNTHCLLFSDSECGDIIGAVQSNLIPSTDADYRDGTFKITPSNPNAIDTDDYLRL